jgi:hypothetical protein
MSFVDKKYIGYISSSLERFAWKKETLANCRCPFCGDSDKHKSKARGYFFPFKDRWVYKCHNCGVSCGVHAVLKQVAPSLAKEYALECFKEKNGVVESSEPVPPKTQKPKVRKVNPLDGLPRLVELSENHEAVRYVLGRGLPESCLAELMYAHDFTKVGKKIDPEYFPNTRREDPRIVIPFFDRSGNFMGVQGRTMNSKESLRYITLKPKGQTKLWYGLWKVDATQRVYVVEGPLDSMILPNCIAMVGANASDDLPDFLAHSDLVFVLDNEPRNKQIVEYNEELIEMGKQVCIWPNGLMEKDINEMLSSRTSESIRQTIDDHTYSGLAARVNLNRWRRV